jgi:hypothetical protein
MITRIKFLPWIILFLIVGIRATSYGQDYYSRFLYVAEFSPSTPTEKFRVFENPFQQNSYTLRNSFGMRTFGNLFIGMSGTLRFYRESELSLAGRLNEIQTKQTLQNFMIGLGPFATQYIQLSEKFYLTGTFTINLEQGKGKFYNTIISGSENTGERIGQRIVRDIILNSSLDVGFAYQLNKHGGIKLSIQAFNIQRHAIWTVPVAVLEDNLPEGLRIHVDERGSNQSTFLQRPVFHLGIFTAIGDW